MNLHPMILIHILAAVVALLGGMMAMVLRKGSGLHGAAGTVFFGSMVVMSLTGAYGGAFIKPVMINVVAGLLTFYLVVTAWRAGRRRNAAIDRIDRIGSVYVLLVGIGAWLYGLKLATSAAPAPAGVTAPIYFVFGAGALWSAWSDRKMIRRGTLTGSPRIRRHLWRMGTAFLIALMSFYPGQGKLFPSWLRGTFILLVPHILVFVSMIFWMIRTRARRNSTAAPPVISSEAAEATNAAVWA